jgi:hypothetical protein
MESISEDWEIVSRKTYRRWIASFFMVVLGLFLEGYPPGINSSVTWTVRQKSTGMVRRVTAASESQAAAMIAKGLFDSE